MSEHVIDLADCAAAPLERVGGKAHGLGRLIERSLEVPPGFVVTTDAYRSFVEQAGLDREIARLLAGAEDVAEVQHTAAAIAELFAAAPFESAEIDSAYARIGDGHVAVRSSAAAEDGADASYAGAQDTHLWVRGAGEVRRHVVACWSSLHSAPAISYRRRLGGAGEPAMAVVVQAMVAAEAAGVMFTIDPVTGDPSQITIESTLGLGLPLVGGEVTPDRFCVDKVTLEIRSRTIAVKPFADRPPSGAEVGPQRRELSGEAARASSIDDGEVLALARLGRDLEQAFDGPVDVEWALGEGAGGPRRIHLLQARPETVWSQAKQGAVRPSTVLNRIAASIQAPRR